MGKKQIIIYEYECDQCGYTSKNAFNFFEITGSILNGDGTYTYISVEEDNFEKPSVFLCKNCFQKSLIVKKDKEEEQLKEIKPEIVEEPNVIEKEEEKEIDEEFSIAIEDFGTINKKNLETIIKKFKIDTDPNDFIRVTKDLKEFFFKYIKAGKTQELLEKILNKYFDEVIYIPPETPKTVEAFSDFPDECYIIFKRIDNEDEEEETAKSLGFPDKASLYRSYGRPLKENEIYYMTKMYIVKSPTQFEGYYDSIRYIDGLIFGAPNIKQIECYVEESGKHCFIDRNSILSI